MTALPVSPSLHVEAPGDGTPLALYRGTMPDSGSAPRGSLLLVHGLGEHAGRYQEAAARFQGWGFQVWALDQRGHGQSGGIRGGLPTPADLVADLKSVILRIREIDGAEAPLTLLGHSMGGAVCARLVAEEGGSVSRLILSSPALALGLPAWRRGLIRLAQRIAPDFALSNGLSVQGISRDPAVVRAYKEDPQVHDRITPALAGFLLDTEERMCVPTGDWPVPTLILWAGSDLLVDPAGSERFLRAAPTDMVQGECFPDMYHEILNEPDRDQVFAVIRRWLGSGPRLGV